MKKWKILTTAGYWIFVTAHSIVQINETTVSLDGKYRVDLCEFIEEICEIE